jgi:hypothetical protein
MAVQSRDQLQGFRDGSSPRAHEVSAYAPPDWRRTSSLGNDLPTQQRILEDIFMHAVARSRTCRSIRDRIEKLLRGLHNPESAQGITPNSVLELSETLGFLEMTVRDLCAQLAPAAVERARMLANIDPDPDQQKIFDLEGERLDNFLCPIFADAGIASDLMGGAESSVVYGPLRHSRNGSRGQTSGGPGSLTAPEGREHAEGRS